MPGLIAIIDPSGKSDLKKLASQMSESIKHNDSQTVHYYVDEQEGIALGRVCTGILNPEPQPIFNEDKSLAIVMEGEIFNYEEEKRRLSDKGHNFTINNDPEFVLHLYEELGHDFVRKLNGFFVLAIWDYYKKTLIIANDRYGFRPFYYSNIGRGVVFCSEAKGILEHESANRNVDNRGAIEFLSFGHTLGERTLFKNIYLLLPASVWRVGKRTLYRNRYWNFFDHMIPCTYSDQEFLERASSVFKQAVNRQLSGEHQCAVSLTGGVDSRSVISVIDHCTLPIYSFCHGQKDCLDLELAEKLALKTTGNRHHSFLLDSDFLSNFPDYTRQAIYLLDGVNKQNTPVLYSRSKMKKYVDIELNASGSDYTNYWPIPNKIVSSKDTTEFSRNCYRKYAVSFDQRLFKHSWFQDFHDEAVNALHDILASIPSHVSNIVKAMHFFVMEHTRKQLMSSWILASNFIEYRFPYYDNEVIDLFLKVPLHLLKRQKVIPRYIIESHRFDLTRIPIEVDHDISVSFYENRFNYAQRYINYLGRRLGKKLPWVQVRLSHGRPYTNYDNWMRNELMSWVKTILLDPRTLGRGYYDSEVLRQMIDQHMNRKKDLSTQLGIIISFELWHRLFID